MRKVRDVGAALMNERERQVMMASAPERLMELSRRELQAMVKRARVMMERYAQRMERMGRGGPGTGGRIPLRSRKVEGAMHTRRKAAMFRTALARFELRLGRMAKAALRTSRPATRKPMVRKPTRVMPSRAKRTTRAAAPRTKPAMARATPPRTKTVKGRRMNRAMPLRTKSAMETRKARATPPQER